MYSDYKRYIDMDSILYVKPEQVTNNKAGFSCDIGGSLAKVIYRSKDDYEHGKPKFKDQSMGRLRTKLFRNEERDKIGQFVRNNCDLLPRDGLALSTYTTGFLHNLDDVEKQLKVKINPDNEHSCFIRALNYLLKHKSEEVFDRHPVDGVKQAKARIAMLSNIMGDLNNHEETDFSGEEVDLNSNKTTDENRPALPCLLAMAGSGICFIWVRADGTWLIIDGTPMGGKYFQGMANLITGETSYEKQMEMAARGDPEKVDTLVRDMRIVGQGGYEGYPSNLTLYAAGKAGNKKKEEFAAEDKVASLLRTTCYTLVQLLFANAATLGVNNIYMCGNFVNHEIVRTNLTRDALSRAELAQQDPTKRVHFRYIKNGGFYGALGAYLRGGEVEKKSED